MAAIEVLMITRQHADKGTQGALIAAHSASRIREPASSFAITSAPSGAALGQAVEADLDRGQLVADQVTLDIVQEALVRREAAGGGGVPDGVQDHAPEPGDRP